MHVCVQSHLNSVEGADLLYILNNAYVRIFLYFLSYLHGHPAQFSLTPSGLGATVEEILRYR